MVLNINKLKEYNEQKFKEDLRGMENYKYITNMTNKLTWTEEFKNRFVRSQGINPFVDQGIEVEEYINFISDLLKRKEEETITKTKHIINTEYVETHGDYLNRKYHLNETPERSLISMAARDIMKRLD